MTKTQPPKAPLPLPAPLLKAEQALAAQSIRHTSSPRNTINRPSTSLHQGTPPSPDLSHLPTIPLQTPGADLEVTRLLGEGGMGRVELARQHSLSREVALKTVKPSKQTPTAIESILKEAKHTGSLEHPNIVPIHQLGHNGDGKPVLVMKRVEGTSWADILDQADHPHWDKVSSPDRLRAHIEILIQVCNAVAFAHSRGVVHRDIKPENVMLGSFGEVYLMDWGVAMDLREDRGNDWIVGTPAYMAPEMIEGDRRVCPQTDVFLLGACLHEVLTGQVLHQGENLKQVLKQAYTLQPFDYPSDVSHELAELCRRACAPEPLQRLPSAEDFRLWLASWLQHQSSRQLAAEAQQALLALEELLAAEEGMGAREKTYRALFTECRFGYQQALKQWPDNPRAQRGLQQCLELGIKRALRDQNRGLAASLLAELSQPVAALEEALQRLDETLDRKARDHQDLLDLKDNLDFTVARRQRVIVIALVCFLAGLIGLLLSRFDKSGAVAFDYRSGAVAAAALLVGLIIGPLFWGKLLLKTTLNRRFLGVCVIVGTATVSNRFISLSMDLPIRQTLQTDLLIASVIVAMGGLTVDARFFIMALLLILSVFVGALLPGYELQVQGYTLLLGALIYAGIWWAERPQGESQP